MKYVAELTATNQAGRFVHFKRDVDFPCAWLVRKNLPIIIERDEGYGNVRVLAVRPRETFDVPITANN